MRKNFVDILKSAKIDIKKEYSRLYNLLYGIYEDGGIKESSLYMQFNSQFSLIWFRGTAITLEEFDEEKGFNFEAQPQNFSIDYLVSFCEYFYNITMGFMGSFPYPNYLQFILQQINTVISAIGYMSISQDGFTVFVEKDQSAIAVAEIIEDSSLSYKTIYYNHHSMKGDIEGKREILLKYANLLEPKQALLHNINSTLKKDLFYLFNNLNIRHNNIDSTDKSNYKKYVKEMLAEQIEKWYDETYQMCLLAFLEMEHHERKKEFDVLKENIEKV